MRIIVGNDRTSRAIINPDVSQVTVTEAYLGVLFTGDPGEAIGVCQRDGGFEVGYRGGTWAFRNGEVIALGQDR